MSAALDASSQQPEARDVSHLRPPMFALIRACVVKNWHDAGDILRHYPTEQRDTMTVLAQGAAGMVLEACGGDEAAALAVVDHWLKAAITEAASKITPPA